MQRIGKGPKDLFTSTVKPAVAKSVRPPAKPVLRPAVEKAEGRGRPPVHEEPWKKITTVLFDRQVVYLDRISNDIRAKTGAIIKRTEIIRALVDALAESDLDLTTTISEAEVKSVLAKKLGGKT